ncbi:MAG: TonB family protein [Acidobacteriota bacterium]
MTGYTRFGNYVLLKKLAEDTLGETYRAGLLEGDMVRRVVLLRIFARSGLGGQRLHSAADTDLAGKVRGPGLTTAVDTGVFEQLAWAAYDYTTGPDLVKLLERTTTGFQSLPTEHGVLIVERLAKGLAILHQRTEAPNCHGFLVPPLVLATNEGEARLLGLEHGRALAANVETFPTELTVFTSPEVRNGGTPGPVDDVYGLGALLWQLTTGSPPPETVDPNAMGRLSNQDGEALDQGLTALLAHSLAPAGSRLANAEDWHRELSKWMFDAEVKATNFDLAFFIHDLFRDEIRREEAELEDEKNVEIAPISSTQIPITPPPSVPGEATTGPIPTTAPPLDSGPVAKSGSRSRLWLVAAALLALAVGVISVLLLFSGKNDPSAAPTVAVQSTASTPAPTTTPPVVQELDTELDTEGDPAAASDPEVDTASLDALERMLEERRKGLTEELGSQMEDLQAQLEEARRLEEESIRQLRETPSAAPPASASEPAAAPEVADTTAATDDAATDVPEPDQATPAATEPTAGAATPTPATTSSSASPTEPAPTDTVAAANTAPPPPPTVTTPAPPAAVEVKPPELVDLPRARYPPQAKRMEREATVLIKVLVGTDGKVRDAEPISKREAGFGFDQAAITAARRATFRPATRDGAPQSMWTTIVISFKLDR